MNNNDFLWKTLDTVNKWVTQADAKAVALLAANGAIAGMIFVHLDNIIPKIQSYCWLLTIGILALCGLVFSVFFALRCVTPRLKVDEPNSVTYFRHIAQYACTDYETKLKETLKDKEHLENELARQIWANSRVADKKYHWVSLSVWSIIVALVLLITEIAIYYGVK